MKSSSKKEDTDKKKKYVFFSDPDIIVQCAEASVAVSIFSNFYVIINTEM